MTKQQIENKAKEISKEYTKFWNTGKFQVRADIDKWLFAEIEKISDTETANNLVKDFVYRFENLKFADMEQIEDWIKQQVIKILTKK